LLGGERRGARQPEPEQGDEDDQGTLTVHDALPVGG
jgi:hypothetical protein